MINWDEVVPGETVLESTSGSKFKVKAVAQDEVWLQYKNGTHGTFSKVNLRGWSIEDPWEEITQDCSIGFWDDFAVLYYKKERLDQRHFEFGNFKLGEGLRVFKRKEG